jgi:hypothetical protein
MENYSLEAPGQAAKIIQYIRVFIARRNVRLRPQLKQITTHVMQPRLIGHELLEVSPLDGALRFRLLAIVLADELEEEIDAILLVTEHFGRVVLELRVVNELRKDETLRLWKELAGDLQATDTDKLDAVDRDFIRRWKANESTKSIAELLHMTPEQVRKKASSLRKQGHSLPKRKPGPKSR